MKNKQTVVLLILLTSLCSVKAQNVSSFYPFKGFHVGLTGQTEFIQPCSFVYLQGTDPAPRARWTTGWEVGMEFSYHFAKYFGASIGINYGTILSYISDCYLSTIIDYDGEWKEVNAYDQAMTPMNGTEFLFPIKFEFHYPIGKNLFFTAEAGVKIKGIFKRLSNGKDGIGEYSNGYSLGVYPPPPSNIVEIIDYYDDYGWRNLGKISCNLLVGLGLYYQLPYGDLLRFTAGVNMSFNNIIEGYYYYYLTDSYGTLSVKNDFIYTQLSYIHTLNFQKAKRFLKRKEVSFSSKKERRKRIIDLLNDW